jgi:hypothetical protein
VLRLVVEVCRDGSTILWFGFGCGARYGVADCTVRVIESW